MTNLANFAKISKNFQLNIWNYEKVNFKFTIHYYMRDNIHLGGGCHRRDTHRCNGASRHPPRTVNYERFNTMVMRFKQAIQIPEKVTQTIFNLPCVSSVTKFDGHIFYDLEEYVDRDGNLHEVLCENGEYAYAAIPGNWLCESEDGDWYVLDDDQYKNLSSEED